MKKKAARIFKIFVVVLFRFVAVILLVKVIIGDHRYDLADALDRLIDAGVAIFLFKYPSWKLE